jgi:oligo-1,6-glucosidase
MGAAWWKESVVYQIYPRSFMDSNGDGIGDIRGIISKLDYLGELGVDVIWLSPVYDSPNDDMGYDIRNYKRIMDEFGTLEDWKDLLSGLHSRGIRLIMDLVVNHTSDEHAWFMESRRSKDSPYRDYYIWRPGKEGREPNNWGSIFGGSAWEYDEGTDEYYLHLFSRKQPDLNWDNPKVREEVYEMMTWWLDQGIDGFRLDVINLISKDPALPDGWGDGRYAWGGAYFTNGPRVHEYLKEMNERVLSKYDVMTVGETPGAAIEDAIKYANLDGSELNMVFQFEHMDLDSAGSKWNVSPWTLSDLKTVMSKWQKGLEGRAWNSLYTGNHDQPRAVSRFGNDTEYRVQSAKMLGAFIHMMQGTPYVYQGEELGMTNVQFEQIDQYRDIETLNMYHEAIQHWGWNHEQAMQSIYAKGRDNARTPMQWDDSKHAGFTAGEPWIGVNPNHKQIHAEQAISDTDSVFHFYRKLIKLRKTNRIVVDGSYDLLYEEHDQIYAYMRSLGNERLLVVLNFYSGHPEFHWPEWLRFGSCELLLGNYEPDGNAPGISFVMRPYEARIYRMTGVV